MKIVIVGGVAGGANVATRARRLSESAEIVLIERGPYISFANCGLPYHIGGEIPSRDSLLVQTPEQLRRTFEIDVRVRLEVIAITANEIHLDPEPFDRPDVRRKLRSSGSHTGRRASPAGIARNRPGWRLSLRNLADMDRINEWIARTGAGRAVVAGAGFVGLEVAEQLQRRGLAVTVIDSEDHVLAPFDVEMASPIAAELARNGVNVIPMMPSRASSAESRTILSSQRRTGAAPWRHSHPEPGNPAAFRPCRPSRTRDRAARRGNRQRISANIRPEHLGRRGLRPTQTPCLRKGRSYAAGRPCQPRWTPDCQQYSR